jgi:ubiquinone/menaquinone biosynthesis C-methylase UbiE
MDTLANITRFSGFADRYDQYRPSPPPIVTQILTQLAQVPRPGLVVDIGCGTGLSTRLWAGRAERVVGVEPNADMRRQAERATTGPAAAAVTYREGTSTRTGLPDGCADIVTCVQSLHWMDPAPTFTEIARILRDGGVFAACDCDWPPTMHWQAEAAYAAFTAGIGELETRHGVSTDVRKWPKQEHLARMKASGAFRYTKEVLVHQTEPGSADRLVGLAKTLGSVASLLKHGLTEAELGLESLAQTAHRVLGESAMPWYFSYRLRVGIK